MERWSGKVAVVTGASAGIGAVIAEELVKKGVNVVGLARRVERIQELATKLKSQSGKLYAVKCDLTQEADIKAAFQWVKSNLGRVDILINNAGGSRASNLIDGPADKWRFMLDLNVMGLSICTSEALQIMKEKNIDDGHIIHINSIAGHYIPNTPLAIHMYSAAKTAVLTLTEGLRRELVREKSKIRVTSVSPGLVETEFLEASGRNLDPKQFYSSLPCLQAKDIADCVLFALAVPPHVQIHELTVKPTGETF